MTETCFLGDSLFRLRPARTILVFLLFRFGELIDTPVQPIPTQIEAAARKVAQVPMAGLLAPNSAGPWRPISIRSDFSAMGDKSGPVAEFIQGFLVPYTLSRLKSMISVKSSGSIPPFSSTACNDYFSVPAEYHLQETNADLILFFRLVDSSSKVTAFSLVCGLSQEEQRPVVGVVTLNVAHFPPTKSQIEVTARTLIHEILHVMAFSPVLYDRFPIGASRTYVKAKSSGGSSQTKIVLPGLLSFAREHFACGSLDGLLLEDEGDSGSANSHFEKKLLGNEIMTGQLSAHQVISNFTLHFVNDIGWYKSNFSLAEKLTWGEKKGCSFIDDSCQLKFDEFCNDSSGEGCTSDFLAKSPCVSSSLTNSCRIREYTQGKICTQEAEGVPTTSFEKHGPSSRCFLTNQNGQKSSGCYQSRCLDANTIQLTIEDSVYNCASALAAISHKGTSVVCPDPAQFCPRTESKCPGNCSGRGVCLSSGVCQCFALFKGDSCQEEVDCSREKFCSLFAHSLSPRNAQEANAKFAGLNFAYLLVAVIFIL
jgi:leishmanolysin